MADVQISISGDQKVLAAIRRLGETLADMSLAFEHLGKMIVDYYSGRVFASQGGVYGARWPGLADSTLAYKTAHIGDMLGGASASAPLIFSGRMQSSFEAETGPQTLRVYNETDYFQYHQLGTQYMPQRQMIGFNEDIKKMIVTEIKANILEKLHMAGGI